MPAAVEVRASSHVMIRGCTFRHVGGAGVTIGAGSSHGAVVRSLFDDVSGSAVRP